MHYTSPFFPQLVRLRDKYIAFSLRSRSSSDANYGKYGREAWGGESKVKIGAAWPLTGFTFRFSSAGARRGCGR